MLSLFQGKPVGMLEGWVDPPIRSYNKRKERLCFVDLPRKKALKELCYVERNDSVQVFCLR